MFSLVPPPLLLHHMESPNSFNSSHIFLFVWESLPFYFNHGKYLLGRFLNFSTLHQFWIYIVSFIHFYMWSCQRIYHAKFIFISATVADTLKNEWVNKWMNIGVGTFRLLQLLRGIPVVILTFCSLKDITFLMEWNVETWFGSWFKQIYFKNKKKENVRDNERYLNMDCVSVILRNYQSFAKVW